MFPKQLQELATNTKFYLDGKNPKNIYTLLRFEGNVRGVYGVCTFRAKPVYLAGWTHVIELDTEPTPA